MEKLEVDRFMEKNGKEIWREQGTAVDEPGSKSFKPVASSVELLQGEQEEEGDTA